MNPEVVAVGELIIDFVSTASGVGLQGAPGFLKAAGGAPANVAVGLARLGTRSAFIGRLGADPFGRFLEGTLRKEGVGTQGICFDANHGTRLAFVSLGATGEREFEFWERSPADEQLTARDVPSGMLSHCTVVHISSFLLLKEPARSTVKSIASAARKKGRLISFDPNIRIALWPSPAMARRQIMRIIRSSDIVKLNAEEAGFLTGSKSQSRSAASIRSMGPSLVVITDGAKGCFYQSAQHEGRAEGFRVCTVDTTGCGDAFLAGLLHRIVRDRIDLREHGAGALYCACRYGNAAGALASLSRGAIAAMPTAKDVDRFLSAKSRRS
jgi:fructokinase